MVNHALFAGLLQAGATPISDDPFHSQALALKLARALQDPAVQQAQAIHARQQKLDRLAASALLDAQLSLPVPVHPSPWCRSSTIAATTTTT
jgi:hypothetical protein